MFNPSLVNLKSLSASLNTYGKEGPFDHCVIDNFFTETIAYELEKEFPSFGSDIWHSYNNPLEVKKTCNNWNSFAPKTYQVFAFLNSDEFLSILTSTAFSNQTLYSDVGLHGGGWHIHKNGGKLNTHLDYSIHPKLGLQRKLNIIIYLNSNWKKSWGGELGFWENNTKEKPGKLVKKIEPKFNRAVLFDTTQNSWHGLPNPVLSPEGELRKSLAIYYLCHPSENSDKRGKALYVPTDEQSNDKEVLDLIKKRANIDTASSVYSTKK